MEPVHLPTTVVAIDGLSWRLVWTAIVIGAISALAASLVRLSFRWLQWLFTGSAADAPVAAFGLGPWRRALTPVAGALLASGVLWLHGWQLRRAGRKQRPYVEYVLAVRRRSGVIPLRPNLWRTLSAASSVSSGAAVGREGSMIQFAAAVASTAVRRWRIGGAGVSGAFLVACGVAGGVTVAYHAPLAAVFFAAEIVLGGIAWRQLPLLALAAGAGLAVSAPLLGYRPLYPVHAELAMDRALALLPVLAVVCGLLGPAYQWLLHAASVLRRLPAALLWSGALVGLVSLLDARVWGNGDVALRAALGVAELPGVAIGPLAVVHMLGLRLLATLACVGTGTVGGVFTPTLFAGGALGSLLGRFAGGASGSQLWAVAGMSLLMAAVTHAPIMAAVMAVELTGDWRLLPLLLAMNWVSWQIARRLAPGAMYAIASQTPTQGPPPPVRDRVAREGDHGGRGGSATGRI